MVLVADDVALAAIDRRHAGRRGLAGTILVHKVAGAAAEAGASLAEVAAEARAAAAVVRHDGRGALPLHRPGRRPARFHPGRERDRAGTGHPRRARRPPRADGTGRRTGRSPARRDPRGSEPSGPERAWCCWSTTSAATPTMELAIVARRAVAVLEDRRLTRRAGLRGHVPVGAGDGRRLAVGPPGRRRAPGSAGRPDRRPGLAQRRRSPTNAE